MLLEVLTVLSMVVSLFHDFFIDRNVTQEVDTIDACIHTSNPKRGSKPCERCIVRTIDDRTHTKFDHRFGYSQVRRL